MTEKKPGIELKLCMVEGCTNQWEGPTTGMCKLHATRFRRTGRVDLKSYKEKLMERIVKDEATGCWNYIRYKTELGYGRFRMNGKKTLAPRASWAIHNGEIPKGLLVCHKCDNPSCVNPDHLFLGTNKDNVRDCIAKGRFKAGERFKGKPAWNRKTK